jgi:hypothetical protein
MTSDYTTFYDHAGRPVAYLADDGTSIFTFPGAPVAYLAGDGVFDYGASS